MTPRALLASHFRFSVHERLPLVAAADPAKAGAVP